MKLAFTCRPTASSLWDLALGDRFSQAWKPDRDTPNASHSHATEGLNRVGAKLLHPFAQHVLMNV